MLGGFDLLQLFYIWLESSYKRFFPRFMTIYVVYDKKRNRLVDAVPRDYTDPETCVYRIKGFNFFGHLHSYEIVQVRHLT